MEKIRGTVIILTAWISFIVALWLALFQLLPWHAPTLFALVVTIVVSLAEGNRR